MCQWINMSVHNNVHIIHYRYYFQLLSPEAPSAYGYFSIIKHFGWKKVGIITQGENLFIAVSFIKPLMFDVSADAYKTPKFRFCNNSYNSYVSTCFHSLFFSQNSKIKIPIKCAES